MAKLARPGNQKKDKIVAACGRVLVERGIVTSYSLSKWYQV